MAKIQSRDEKIQEQWQKYFKNIEKENDLIRVLLKYYKEEIEDRIKDYYIKNTKTADKNQTNEEYPDIVSIPSKIENISVNELKNLLNKIVNFLSKEVPFSIDNNVDLSQKFKKFYEDEILNC